MMKEGGHLVPHVVKGKDGEPVEHDAEPRTIATPLRRRGGVEIEPWLTDQWYVDAESWPKAPIEAVGRRGRDRAGSWEKTFFNWMDNIQPWCVSRQLWWGHRIPAWYGPSDGEIVIKSRPINIDTNNRALKSCSRRAEEALAARSGLAPTCL